MMVPTVPTVHTGKRHRSIAPVVRAAASVPLWALALVAAPASAQHVVEGRIVGASDGMPIADATVRAVGGGLAGGDLVLGTDSAGFFRFDVPEDRPGIAIEVEVIGYRPFNRTWILPLEQPIVIGLRREAVELEGIDVEVDAPRVPLPVALEYRVRSIVNGIPRTAGTAELRDFAYPEADLWDFLPEMNVAIGTGCPECVMASGRFRPTFIVDDRSVSYEEFRTWTVEEICRVDVVTIPVAGEPLERGFVMAYSCGFLRDVASGRARLPLMVGDLPFMNMWGGGG